MYRTAKPNLGPLKAAAVQMTYIQGQPTCLSKLQQIKELLLEDEPPSADTVQQIIGHGIMAGNLVTFVLKKNCYFCLVVFR